MSDLFAFTTDEAPEYFESSDRLPALTGAFTIQDVSWKLTRTGKVMVVVPMKCDTPDEVVKKEGKVIGNSPKGMTITEFCVLGTDSDPLVSRKETVADPKNQGASRLKGICQAVGYTGSWGFTDEQGHGIPRLLMSQLQGKSIGLTVVHERDNRAEYAHRYAARIKKYHEARTVKPTISAVQMEDLVTHTPVQNNSTGVQEPATVAAAD